MQKFSKAHRICFGNSLLPAAPGVEDDDIDLGESGEHAVAFTKFQVRDRINLARKLDIAARQPSHNNIETFDQIEAIIILLSETAIRKHGVCSLRHTEIMIDHEKPHVRKYTKGKKLSMIRLSKKAVRTIRPLLAAARENPEGLLFPSPVNKKQPCLGWYIRYKKHLKLNGMYLGYPHKTLHSFRSYVATRIALKGGTNRDVAEQLQCTEKVADGYVTRSLTMSDRAIDFIDDDVDEGIDLTDNIVAFKPIN